MEVMLAAFCWAAGKKKTQKKEYFLCKYCLWVCRFWGLLWVCASPRDGKPKSQLFPANGYSSSRSPSLLCHKDAECLEFVVSQQQYKQGVRVIEHLGVQPQGLG